MYGQDLNLIQRTSINYNSYQNIKEQDDKFQKISVLDVKNGGSKDFNKFIYNLDIGAVYYYRACVELNINTTKSLQNNFICGDIEKFETIKESTLSDSDVKDLEEKLAEMEKEMKSIEAMIAELS